MLSFWMIWKKIPLIGRMLTYIWVGYTFLKGVLNWRVLQNLSLDREKTAVDTDDMTDDDSAPQITLQEMLDELKIEDEEMPGEDDNN